DRHGIVGLILPHKFTQADFGEGIRGFLTGQKALRGMVNLTTNMVFDEVSTYTCLLFLDRAKAASWHYIEVPETPSLESALRQLGSLETQPVVSKTRLSHEPWVLAPSELQMALDKMESGSVPLEAITEGVFQGLISGGDQLLFLPYVGNTNSGN